MEAWGGVALTIVAATGNCTQLYPNFLAAGVVPASANAGDLIRSPCEGTLFSCQIKTDGSNGGTLEIWDFNGHESGIDVSSSNVITNAQIAAAVAAGTAKLIYDQNFVADGTTPIQFGPRQIMKGLVARVSNSGPTGTAELNLVARGCFHNRIQAGDM